MVLCINSTPPRL
jgi:hypothetical protein